MKVTLINGSPASKSHTYSLLIHIGEQLKKQKVEVRLWDLRKNIMPVVSPEYHLDPAASPVRIVRAFIRLIEESDAIILGTPLYHGSYSGVLKNAIDHLSPTGFENKIVGLVSNAGGIKNTIACEHLRSVVRTLYGYTTQSQIGTSRNDYEETKTGYELKDEDIKKRCQRLVEEIITLTRAMA